MSLSILNVGEGDTKLTFDKDKPLELERTRRIIGDMLKLGYAILVRVGETVSGKPKYRRATGFDPTHDEYLVMDVPDESVIPIRPAFKRGRRSRVSAPGRPAIAVARSAGGMSDRADSVEMHNLERFDSHAQVRNNLRSLASLRDQWCGLPMPLEDSDLTVDPRYPLAHVFKPKEQVTDEYDTACKMRNTFYSHHKRRDILIWSEADGKIEWGTSGGVHHFTQDLETMGASVAWGIEQESAAIQLLATMIPHHAFKKYLLTGMFLERSERSGVFYVFRRLKPTVATSGATGDMKIIAVLCMHPIAYYSGTWAGAMCPTDDVIAHLSLMRGDEALYWRRCNQHPAYRPEAGL
jgi:hypothetical protein